MSFDERLTKLEESIEGLRRIVMALEKRQSELVGRLVEAGIWKVDPATGRSTGASAGGQSGRARAIGSEGRGSALPSKDPVVRQDPPRWIDRGGQSFQGKRFSETSSRYLDALASYLDWCADRAAAERQTTTNGAPRAPYILDDAKVARAWASVLAKREEARR